jgi:hypothetical protein
MHPEIEMFSQSLGTRSIKDFNYIKHSNGSMINLKVVSNSDDPEAHEK